MRRRRGYRGGALRPGYYNCDLPTTEELNPPFSEEDFFRSFPMRHNGQPMFQVGDMFSQHDRIVTLRGCGVEPRPAHPEPAERHEYERTLGAPRRLEPDLPEPVYDHYPKGYFDDGFPAHCSPPRQLVPNLEPGLSREEAAAKADWERKLEENYQEQAWSERRW